MLPSLSLSNSKTKKLFRSDRIWAPVFPGVKPIGSNESRILQVEENLLSKSQVCTVFRSQVIGQNVPHKFREHFTETPGGAVALWLVRWTPDREVRVRILAGALRCVLGQDTLLLLCLSPPRCINGYRRIYCWG